MSAAVVAQRGRDVYLVADGDKAWLFNERLGQVYPGTLGGFVKAGYWTEPADSVDQDAVLRQATAAIRAESRSDASFAKTSTAVMLRLPPDLAAQLERFGQTIAPQDLAPGGLETDPHITLKYGIEPDISADEIKDRLAGTEPPSVVFGPIAAFPAGEDGIPLYVSAQSSGLYQAHQRLGELPNQDSRTEYVPHVTIAYVTPEARDRYVGQPAPIQGHHTLDHVVISPPSGQKTELRLGQMAAVDDAHFAEAEHDHQDGAECHWVTIDGNPVCIAGTERQAKLKDAKATLDKLRDGSGRVVGAPAQVQTPSQLVALRERLNQLAEQGKDQKDWYRDSSKAILSAAGGNRQDAEKLAQLIAIYSPNTPVSANMNNALAAWYQYKAGEPIRVAMAGMDERASNLLYKNQDWEGRKTNNFYRNLMAEIDPKVYREMASTSGQTGVTADIWMMRAFDYRATEGAKTGSGAEREYVKAPSARQYDFIQNEVTRLAQDRGWSPEQAQAAIWVATRAGSMGESTKSYDYHYGNALAERAAIVHDAEGARLLRDDQGRDVVARAYNLVGGDNTFALPKAPQSVGGVKIPANVGRVQSDAREAISAYTATRGLLLREPEVAWTRMFEATNQQTANGAVIDAGRPLSSTEAASVQAALTRGLGGHAGVAVIPTSTGAWVLNTSQPPSGPRPGAISNPVFQKAIPGALDSSLNVDTSYARARYDGEFLRNDWTTNPNGETYRSAIQQAGRLDTLRELESQLGRGSQAAHSAGTDSRWRGTLGTWRDTLWHRRAGPRGPGEEDLDLEERFAADTEEGLWITPGDGLVSPPSGARPELRLGRVAVPFATDTEEGHWVTIDGNHIMIGKGGEVLKGPKELVGQTLSQVRQRGRVTEAPKAATDQLREINKAEGSKTGDGSLNNPIHVGADLDHALKLLGEGNHIRLDQPEQVSTLLDKLASNVDDARAKGEKAPNYDLGKVTVAGTNLFTQDTKGIPRAEMPQLKGEVRPGSPAAKDAINGRADISDALLRSLKEAGIRVYGQNVPASHLRATQLELDGAKVAGMVRSMKSGVMTEEPIFVTRDNYVIDGHHRWAAKVGIDVSDNKLGDVRQRVFKVDMDIGKALDFTRAFADRMGIRQQKAFALLGPALRRLLGSVRV